MADEQQRGGVRISGWALAAISTAVLLVLVGVVFLARRPLPGVSTSSSMSSPAMTVPAWEGRSLSEVTAESRRLGLQIHEEEVVTDEVTAGTVIRQSPAAGSGVPDDGVVVVAVATPPPVTTRGDEPGAESDGECEVSPTTPRAGERYVSVYFGCTAAHRGAIQPFLGPVPDDTMNFMEAAYRLLLAGPSDDEQSVGVTSGFSAGTQGVVEKVTFQDGALLIDLAPDIANATVEEADLAALFATGFQFETVSSVEVRVGRSCETFTELTGWACRRDADTWWHDTAEEVIVSWPRVFADPERVQGACQPPSSSGISDAPQVTLLLLCGNEELDFVPVSRAVAEAEDSFEETLEELVKGPSGGERAAGLHASYLSERTARMVRDVSVEGSRLVVDLRPFVRSPVISNVGTSYGGLVFNTLLNANLFQDPDIDEIEYRVDGSCDRYWEVFEARCSIQIRDSYERAVEELTD